jgi:hypothetical protein
MVGSEVEYPMIHHSWPHPQTLNASSSALQYVNYLKISFATLALVK